jgi:hypothetical protein
MIAKEQARKALEHYLKGQAEFSLEMVGKPYIHLPISDVVVSSKQTEVVNGNVAFEQLSFKGLIKIAYDLQDK